MFCKYCKRKIEPVLVKHSLPFRPHKEKSLTTRFWKVIIRSSAFSVSFSCPLTEAKHIGILSLSCPSTEVTRSVKITAKNTSCEQNIYISAQNVIVCVCVFMCMCVNSQGHAPSVMTMLSKAESQEEDKPLWASKTICRHAKKISPYTKKARDLYT